MYIRVRIKSLLIIWNLQLFFLNLQPKEMM